MAQKGMNFLKRAFDPLGLGVSDDMGTVFVTSGTGVVGHRVVQSLLDAGHTKVRAGIWKGPRALGVDDSVGQYVADQLEGKGATVITFDWMRDDFYGMALAEVKIVFFTMPHFMEGNIDPATLVEQFTAFVNACKKAGVEHFVTTSNDQPGNGAAYNTVLRQCNDVLMKHHIDSRMSYTVLHTAHLMSTPLVLQGPILRSEKTYITASYSMGVNYLSPNDVAHAVVTVLASWKKHKGKTYRLTGSWPPVKDKDVAGLLSTFYGHEIRHDAIGYHDYEEALPGRGSEEIYTPGIVAYAVACEKIKASGDEEKTTSYTNHLELLIGGPTAGRNTAAPVEAGGDGDDAAAKDKAPDGEGEEPETAADAPPAATTVLGFKAETFEQYLANTSSMTLQEYPRNVEV